MIHSYLPGRKQRVKLGVIRSEWLYIKRGVPQGSIVGPTLFNVFINDLLLALQDSCTVYNYADDNTLSFCHHDPAIVKSTLEGAANKAIKWFDENNMKANPSKFQGITFRIFILKGKRIDISNFEFQLQDNVSIKLDETVKLLGMHIDNQLNFGPHIRHLSKKCARQTNVIARFYLEALRWLATRSSITGIGSSRPPFENECYAKILTWIQGSDNESSN